MILAELFWSAWLCARVRIPIGKRAPRGSTYWVECVREPRDSFDVAAIKDWGMRPGPGAFDGGSLLHGLSGCLVITRQDGKTYALWRFD